jgi:hypothetical protein
MLLIGSVSHTPCLVRKALVVNLPCVSLAMRCFLRLGLETQSPKSSPAALLLEVDVTSTGAATRPAASTPASRQQPYHCRDDLGQPGIAIILPIKWTRRQQPPPAPWRARNHSALVNAALCRRVVAHEVPWGCGSRRHGLPAECLFIIISCLVPLGRNSRRSFSSSPYRDRQRLVPRVVQQASEPARFQPSQLRTYLFVAKETSSQPPWRRRPAC